MKLKKGDTILVTGGKDRGRQGKIERVFPVEDRVLVPGVNQYKKHRRKTSDKPGEILTLDRPLSVGNVAVVCPRCKQPTRIGFRFDGAKKIRVCRKCDADID